MIVIMMHSIVARASVFNAYTSMHAVYLQIEDENPFAVSTMR